MSQSPRRRRAMTEQAADAAVDQAPGPPGPNFAPSQWGRFSLT
jgi:hypothetical protein